MSQPTDPRIVRRTENEWFDEAAAHAAAVVAQHRNTQTDTITRQHLESAYMDSDRYIGDALQWVAEHGHEDALVVAVAVAAYHHSRSFATVIDDAAEGEQRW